VFIRLVVGRLNAACGSKPQFGPLFWYRLKGPGVITHLLQNKINGSYSMHHFLAITSSNANAKPWVRDKKTYPSNP